MFIDTNVLIGSRFPHAPDHDAARASLDDATLGDEPLRISRQVVREYLAVLTRPQSWRVQVDREEALDDADALLVNFEVLEDGQEVTEVFLSLCREIPVGGRQIHDANIVATMLAHGEHRLLTSNTRDFRRFADYIELVNA